MSINNFTAEFVFIILVLGGCKLNPMARQNPDEGPLIFQPDFESDSKVISRNADSDIIGSDKPLPHFNNWVKDLNTHPDIGSFNVKYQGGDSTMRSARIISEPAKPRNKVLHFWLNVPNGAGSKGRIQANLYNNQRLKIILPIGARIFTQRL